MIELDVDVDMATTAATTAVFRAADRIRNHMERAVLSDYELSFTAFTVLWVLWIWGPQEARIVADRAGVSRGTLTGVMGTLEKRDLVQRDQRPDDKRVVIVSLTDDGWEMITTLFPQFRDEQERVGARLDTDQKWTLAELLGAMVTGVDEAGG